MCVCSMCVRTRVHHGGKGQSKIVSTSAELFYSRGLYAWMKYVLNPKYSFLCDLAYIVP